jgi:predicted nucleic acid-binding protein
MRILLLKAAAVGHEEKLALADSIIDTICEKINATLWTQDAHFSRMPRVGPASKTFYKTAAFPTARSSPA